MHDPLRRIRLSVKSLRKFRRLAPVVGFLEISYLAINLQIESYRNSIFLKRVWGKEEIRIIPLDDVVRIKIPVIQDGYCYNPTILFHEEKFFGFARISNVSYKPEVDLFGRSILREEVTYLLNGIVSFILDCNLQLSDYSVVRPLTGVPNLEDPKAVLINDSPYLFCNLVSKEQNGVDRSIHCSVVALNLTNNQITTYKSPFHKNIEKNWVPFVSQDSNVSFYYSVEPQIRLDFSHSLPEPRVTNYGNVSRHNLHGGSQVVEVSTNVFMRVARRRVVLPGRKIATLSYIVFHNSEGEIVRISKPFLFREFGFEICNGLTSDKENLVFSWGENDKDMFVGRISVQKLLAWALD